MSAIFGLQPASARARDWRIPVDDAALLLVDYQERLMPAIADSRRVLGRACTMARAAAALGIPIRVSVHVPTKLGPTAPELLELLDDPAARQVTKSVFSATASLLESFDTPQTVLVAGVETHICVRQTAYDLHAAGKRVVILADACGTRDPLMHDLALQEFRADKIAVTSTEAVCWECVPEAQGELFRKMLSILK
ncbi:amidase [Verrucomicrobia bacterium LW23]|nr:amidase [Verrucomicrobia bacterium LW23]